MHYDRNDSRKSLNGKLASSDMNSFQFSPCEGPDTKQYSAQVFLRSEVVDADPPVNRGRPCEQGRNRQAPVRSTGVVSTACKEGDLSNWGRSGTGGDYDFNVVEKGWRPDRKTERVVVPMKPSNSGGGKGPHFRRAFKEGEER